MINITPIEKYIQDFTNSIKELIDSEVKLDGRDKVLYNKLKYIDCTRITKDGVRLIQTIGFNYIYNITQTIYLIYNYFQDDLDNKLQKILDIHENNIRFEIENPPIRYDTKKNKKKGERNINKYKENNKLSTAQRKNIIKVAKINALKLNLKPINNGNNNTV